MFIFCISGNETFFECVTSCSLECEATHFSGSISFTQFSSQATKFLMDAYGDVIEHNYKEAVELTHRLSDDITPSYSLNDLISTTDYLLTEITAFEQKIQFLEGGYSLFYKFLSSDFSALSTVSNFMTAYNNMYNSTRRMVSQHFTLTVSHVTDIDNLMKFAPVAFENYLNAHIFYTATLTKLTNSETNAKLSIDYLARVIQDEKTKPKQRYLPEKFYSDNTAAQTCNNLYEQTTEGLSKLLQALSYASQKISSWLENNSACIFNSTINIAIPEFKQGKNSSLVPGLWILLECVDCMIINNFAEYETWNQLFATYLTTSIRDSLSNCLLQYEKSLQSTYSATIQPSLVTPFYWNLDDLLVISLATLNTDLEQTKSIIQLYLTGSDNLENIVANLNSIFLSLTGTMNKIENVLLMNHNDWSNNIIRWRNNFIEKYKPLVNSVVSLTQFLTNNTDLINAILSMRIWRHPTVKLNIVSSSTITDNQVTSQIWNDLRNYFQLSGPNFITSTLISAIQYNLNYAQKLCDDMQTMLTNWHSQVNNISDTINQYSQQFLVTDDVIK